MTNVVVFFLFFFFFFLTNCHNIIIQLISPGLIRICPKRFVAGLFLGELICEGAY